MGVCVSGRVGTWHSSCPTCRGSTDSWALGAHLSPPAPRPPPPSPPPLTSPPLLLPLRPSPHLCWPPSSSHTFSISRLLPSIPCCSTHIGPVSLPPLARIPFAIFTFHYVHPSLLLHCLFSLFFFFFVFSAAFFFPHSRLCKCSFIRHSTRGNAAGWMCC